MLLNSQRHAVRLQYPIAANVGDDMGIQVRNTLSGGRARVSWLHYCSSCGPRPEAAPVPSAHARLDAAAALRACHAPCAAQDNEHRSHARRLGSVHLALWLPVQPHGACVRGGTAATVPACGGHAWLAGMACACCRGCALNQSRTLCWRLWRTQVFTAGQYKTMDFVRVGVFLQAWQLVAACIILSLPNQWMVLCGIALAFVLLAVLYAIAVSVLAKRRAAKAKVARLSAGGATKQ